MFLKKTRFSIFFNICARLVGKEAHKPKITQNVVRSSGEESVIVGGGASSENNLKDHQNSRIFHIRLLQLMQ